MGWRVAPARQRRRWHPASGTRPFTFKTIFGEVTVERLRISHNYNDRIEIPSATVWNTSHQLAITENLRDAVCDQMSDRSAGKSRADVCQYAGDEDLLGRSTIIDIVHQEGEQLIVAQRERAGAVLDEASEAQLVLLGPAPVDPDAVTGFVDDDPPLQGVLAVAALEATRRNGEIDAWRREHVLPGHRLPDLVHKAARSTNRRTNWPAPGDFLLQFGKQHSLALGKVSEDEAKSKSYIVKYMLIRLTRRLIDLPPGINELELVQFDGKPSADLQEVPAESRELTLSGS